jgi:F0F1-type ATP synthase membrane subunit c/vacuolar-type H+-ATPase subunit K
VRTVRAISGLWRWRHNPLRRATDLAEAWLALAALLLILVVTPVAGALVGGVAQDSLQESVRNQRASRHLVTATVTRKLDRSPLDADPETSTGRELRTRVLADWTAPDGTAQHGSVMASLKNPNNGDHFTLWTDAQGRIVARPLDSATATTHAVLAGFGAALLGIGLIETARRLIVWRMVRRRYARWDQAWDRAGPDWGRTGTGS